MNVSQMFNRGSGSGIYPLLVLHSKRKLPSDPLLAASSMSKSVKGRDCPENQFHRHWLKPEDTAIMRDIREIVAKMEMTVFIVTACQLKSSLPSRQASKINIAESEARLRMIARISLSQLSAKLD